MKYGIVGLYKGTRPLVHVAGRKLRQPHTIMTMPCSQYPHGHPAAYGPQCSSNGPYNIHPTVFHSYVPHGAPVDAYGRPLAHGDAHSQLHPVAHGPSSQYSQSPGIDRPVYTSQNMTRGHSSQSTGTNGSFSSPQSSASTAGQKE